MRKPLVFLILLFFAGLALAVTEQSTLGITILSPAEGQVLERGQSFQVSIVLQEGPDRVKGASQVSVFFLGKEKLLEETQDGVYSKSLSIPINAKKGTAELVFFASKPAAGSEVLKVGRKLASVQIANAGIALDLVQPALESYSLGETLPISASAEYSAFDGNGKLKVLATIAGKQVELAKNAQGIFEAGIELNDSLAGVQVLKVSAVDSFGNSASIEKTVTITDSAFWLLKKNIIALILGIAALAVIIAYLALTIPKKSRLKKINELEKAKKDLQSKYFQEKSIDYATFKAKAETVDRQLLKLNSKK